MPSSAACSPTQRVAASESSNAAGNTLVDGFGCSAGQPYALLERIAHLLRRHLLDRLPAGNTRDQCLRLRIQRHAIPSGRLKFGRQAGFLLKSQSAKLLATNLPL